MKRFTIRITEKEYANLKLYAALFDKSMNQIVKSMIARFVEDNKPKIREAMEKRRSS